MGFIIFTTNLKTYMANGCYSRHLAYGTDRNKAELKRLLKMASYNGESQMFSALRFAFDMFEHDTLSTANLRR